MSHSAQKYNLNYKTFSQLMSDIEDDISSLSEEGYVSPDKFIKVVQTCNNNLSVKINPVKEAIVSIQDGKGKLPEDFKLLDFAYLCTSYEINYQLSTKYVEASNCICKYNDIRNSCSQISYINDSKGVMSFIVYNKISNVWYNIKQLLPLRIKNSKRYCSDSCLYNENRAQEIQIIKEKDTYYLISNLLDGEIYITYTSEMIDDDGNLLLLDHPLVTEYYEYAIKNRVYEELWLNSLEEVQNKLQYLTEKHKQSRREAIGFVSMCDFAELKEVFFDNRKIFKMKYDRIIQ